MLDIFLFAFIMMYTPGPVTTLALLAGINNQGWRLIPFCLGVGVAMVIMFTGLGFLGATLLPPIAQIVIGLLGGGYIGYLGLKVLKASLNAKLKNTPPPPLSFRHGLLMQLSNPKAPVTILPIVSVQFPAVGVAGLDIAWMSLVLGALAAGSPASYLVLGSLLKQIALKPTVNMWLNWVMGSLLLYISGQYLWASMLQLTT
ncbi:lysine transporter LysE [Maribrevibacterium harenarium]|uniref:Lysine transporter LysE n=1 Tax=Maribrevibacterium harenarium TaxID=2589817 RepID=A0A501WVB3_9GAMM|nr:LysE family transporter [Maribrevibacterium harenarium]TPE53348.1 lysine transporter LysE [Maribrevibacterium harenarium]